MPFSPRLYQASCLSSTGDRQAIIFPSPHKAAFAGSMIASPARHRAVVSVDRDTPILIAPICRRKARQEHHRHLLIVVIYRVDTTSQARQFAASPAMVAVAADDRKHSCYEATWRLTPGEAPMACFVYLRRGSQVIAVNHRAYPLWCPSSLTII